MKFHIMLHFIWVFTVCLGVFRQQRVIIVIIIIIIIIIITFDNLLNK